MNDQKNMEEDMPFADFFEESSSAAAAGAAGAKASTEQDRANDVIAGLEEIAARLSDDDPHKADILKQAASLRSTVEALGKVGAGVIDRGYNSEKDRIDEMADQLIDTATNKINATRDALHAYKAKVSQGREEVDTETQTQEMGVGRVSAAKAREEAERAEDMEADGINSSITDKVSKVNNASRNVRTTIAMGAVRVAGKVGKAMVLVGKKDQAREMLEKVGSASERAVSKDSRLGKILERSTRFGYKIVGIIKEKAKAAVQGAKDFGTHVKEEVKDKAETAALYGMELKDKIVDKAETAALYGMEAKDKIVDKAETAALYGMEAKDQAKAQIKRGASVTIGGMLVAAMAGKKLATAVGRRARDTVKDKIVDPTREKIEDAKETARDAKNVGSKFWDFAKKKAAQAKNLPTNLRARASGLLQKTAEKVITAIAPTKEKQMEAEQRTAQVAQSRDELKGAFDQMTGKKQQEEEGPEL